MDIHLENIHKAYEDSGQTRVIFKSMNACFPSGKRCVILGKSGVGKSSLLNLISGIDVPDTGHIQIGDHRVSDMDDTQRTIFRRRHIGFIYQFFNLIPVLTVYENVVLICKLDGIMETEFKQRAHALLASVGLYDRRNDFPDRLSGGEQQRVAIVRALVNEPSILLADEPTGNLDKENGLQVLEMISTMALQHQKTLIMVTHSQDASQYADMTFRVEDQLLPVQQKTGSIV